jgi:hypothetical protein
MKRLIYVAFYIRSLDLGFGYPLAKSYSPSALGWPLSAPNTLGLLPSELFSSPAVERAFQLLLSTLALIKKPLGFPYALQRLPPAKATVPFLCSPKD